MLPNWMKLQESDVIEVIAPASRCDESLLPKLSKTIEALGFQCKMADPLFQDDFLFAASDEHRAQELYRSLSDTHSKAVWCLRGGYGSARLLEKLSQLPKPSKAKLLLGFSDITLIHSFIHRHWGWPSLHAPALTQLVSKSINEESIAKLTQMLYGRPSSVILDKLTPMNTQAKQAQTIQAPVVGGNLCLVQTSIGTPWQIETDNTILFLEEVDERGYRVDRMLVHLQQTGLLKNIKALIFGDFSGGNEPNGSNIIPEVLARFAKQCDFPVLKTNRIGHAEFNDPLPLNWPLKLEINADNSRLTL